MNPFTDILASTPTAAHSNRSMEVLTERMKELGYSSPTTPPVASAASRNMPRSPDPTRSLEHQFAHFSAVKSNPSISSPHTLMLTPNSHSYEQQRHQVLDYVEKIREIIGSFDASAIMERLDDIGSIGSSLDATSDITDSTKQTNDDSYHKRSHPKISTLKPLDCQLSSLDYVSPSTPTSKPSQTISANKSSSQSPLPSNSILQKQPFYSPIATTQLHAKSFYDTNNSSAIRNLYQESTLNHTYSSNRYSVGLNMLTMSRAHNSADLTSTSNVNLNQTFASTANANTINRSGKYVQKELFPVLTNTSSNLFFSPNNTSAMLASPSQERGTLEKQLSTNSVSNNALNTTIAGSGGVNSKKKEFISEFTVIGIPQEVLSGKKDLARSNRQSSEVLGKFPFAASSPSSSGQHATDSNTPATTPPITTIVENIQEYLFPHGVELQLMSHQDYQKKQREHAFDHTYQIMQFTDANNRIYYAYALIFMEQVFYPTEKLLQELEDLQVLHIAANTIKRYLRYFMYQRTIGIGYKIEDAWKQNIFDAQQRSHSDNLQQTPQRASSTDKSHKRQRSATIHSIFSAVKSVKHAVIGKKNKEKDKLPTNNIPPAPLALRSAMKGANPSHHHDDTATESSEGMEGVPKTNWRGVRVNIRDMGGPNSSGSKANIARHKRSHSAPDYTAILDASSTSMKGGKDASAIGLGLSTRNNLSDINLLDDMNTSNISSAPRSHLKYSHSSTPTNASNNVSFASQWQSLQIPEVASDYDQQLASSSDSQPGTAMSPTASTSRVRSLFTSSKSFVQYQQQQSERVVVSQKAYLMLSECALPALFFRLLQAMLDVQAKKKYGQQPPEDNIVSTNTSSAQVTLPLADAEVMTRFLRFIQSQDCAKVQKQLLKNEFNLSYPPLIRSLMIPKMAPNLAEWTVSVLLSIFPAEVILQIHAYLLLEKSLLVLCSDPCLTSILATAFTNLLQPFNWAGIFVPLLPPLAQEVLDAPVPYIIGMSYPSSYGHDATKRPKLTISTTAMILYVDDFLLYPQFYTPPPKDLEELRSSLSVVDQQKQKQHHQKDDEGTGDIPTLLYLELCVMDYHAGRAPGQQGAGGTNRDYILLATPSKSLIWKKVLHDLKYLQGQFQAACAAHTTTNTMSTVHHHAASATTLLSMGGEVFLDRKLVLLQKHQFIKQLLLDVDANVVYRPIRKVLQLLTTFNRTWTCEILQYSFAWQDICHEDFMTGSLLIHMERILEHYQQQMYLQEAILKTQMFTLLLDQQYAAYNLHLSTRRFIYDWLYFRHYLKSKKPSIFQRRSRKQLPHHHPIATNTATAAASSASISSFY